MANNVEGLMGVSVDKIRELVDANTVIGTPMAMPDGSTLIPVSKVSYGFASGGSDLPSKTADGLFGGGAGANTIAIKQYNFMRQTSVFYRGCHSSSDRPDANN